MVSSIWPRENKNIQMKTKLATPALIACTLFLAIVSGTGLYEHLFGIPQMLRSPATLSETSNNDLGQASKFWIPLHISVLITMISSLVFNWRNPGKKKWILAVFIGYIYTSVVSIFFARELFSFSELTDAAEFSRQTGNWILLSWHRPLIGLTSVVLLMIAISKPSLVKKESK